MSPTRILILGAAGRDFHNFNVVYRQDPEVRVVAFTQAQIPRLTDRRYPASLAGPQYPDGIPILDEADLEAICLRERVDRVVFAYSDVSHATVMHLASRALAAGADFALLGPRRTMLEARVPVIAISAIRTGCGKSQTARWLGRWLRGRGYRVAVLRHPMPYGDLERQRVQRFASRADLDAAGCTAEEREEYEPHLAAGNVVFAGVDYAAIVERAEQEADLIVWDGGNNDFPLLRPDLHIVLVDALRPGQADAYHPGEAVLRMADVIVVNKVDAASAAGTQAVVDEVRAINGRARVVRAASPVRLDDPGAVRGRRVLVVEDGPTITHGGMAYGAGYVAATTAGAAAIEDPRASAAPSVREVFARYPHIGAVLPAVGYDHGQLQALRETIDGAGADVVVSATPLDLAALIELRTPVVRARYEFADAGDPTLAAVVEEFLARDVRRSG
ncbi:MAG TPA: cyclic 2,3-diphosphoglycerate synthase [Methylomirabilota bacterium]|nr:cyclic 2,3-diphosphoglycerate synthase [Methylomirabilota bacterium]